MLELNNVEVLYSDVILAVKGISAQVPTGQCVTLLGANGAGKSTTLKAISNLIKTEDGRVTAGTIRFDGADITGGNPAEQVRRGLVHVMEGRKVLRHMTVEQNLVVGGHMGPGRDARELLDEVYGRIQRLAALRHRTAGYLSGGEQQLLVIGRALMARPKLVMIDEPSLGLAPLMVEEVYGLLADLKASGLTLLIVEQNTRVALELADYGYVMEGGRVVLEGPSASLRSNEDVREFYLGLTVEGERKSFRDMKHYRRRKRWLG
ncbi:ABC transporter ATP-binding protein [Hydrogenophaga sp.]|uniref:ABC transporter ATP-binding protein n=1 Tax=Hydrogenophaga sp. TaxID=1904254 RepID=UPI0025C2CDD2|nr:ABC transporter ATP-binding protein [Hydrogenophaga sp.]